MVDTGVPGGLGAEGQEGAVGGDEHGGRGGRGGQGGQGIQGEPGATGPAYSSWVTRHIFFAFIVFGLGIVLSFAFAGYLYDKALDRLRVQSTAQCEAGNDRSLVQRDDILDSVKALERADLSVVLNLSPEQASEFRRLSKESSDRRLASIPYLDCQTSQRVSLPMS